MVGILSNSLVWLPVQWVDGSIFLAGTADTQTRWAVHPRAHAHDLKNLAVKPMIKLIITSESWDSNSLPDALIFLEITLNMFHRRWHLNSTKSFGTQIALAFICNICPTPFKKMNCHMPISLALGMGVRGSLNSWGWKKPNNVRKLLY